MEWENKPIISVEKNGTDSISMPYDVYLDSDLVGIIFDVGKYSFVSFIQRKLHEWISECLFESNCCAPSIYINLREISNDCTRDENGILFIE